MYDLNSLIQLVKREFSPGEEREIRVSWGRCWAKREIIENMEEVNEGRKGCLWWRESSGFRSRVEKWGESGKTGRFGIKIHVSIRGRHFSSFNVFQSNLFRIYFYEIYYVVLTSIWLTKFTFNNYLQVRPFEILIFL